VRGGEGEGRKGDVKHVIVREGVIREVGVCLSDHGRGVSR